MVSRHFVSTAFPSSIQPIISSEKLIGLLRQDLCLLNLCWLCLIASVLHMVRNGFWTMWSMNFPGLVMTLTNWWFSKSLIPFLKGECSVWIMESQHAVGGKAPLRVTYSNPPAMSRDIFYCIRWLRAPSNLTLSVSPLSPQAFLPYTLSEPTGFF